MKSTYAWHRVPLSLVPPNEELFEGRPRQNATDRSRNPLGHVFRRRAFGKRPEALSEGVPPGCPRRRDAVRNRQGWTRRPDLGDTVRILLSSRTGGGPAPRASSRAPQGALICDRASEHGVTEAARSFGVSRSGLYELKAATSSGQPPREQREPTSPTRRSKKNRLVSPQPQKDRPMQPRARDGAAASRVHVRSSSSCARSMASSNFSTTKYVPWSSATRSTSGISCPGLIKNQCA